MIVVIDYDGTITSNIAFYQQLTFMLNKSGHVIVILSGCKPERKDEVKWYLEKMGIIYHEFITRPENIGTGPKSIGKWKKKYLKAIKADLWFDNEVKNYQDAGVEFRDTGVSIIKA